MNRNPQRRGRGILLAVLLFASAWPALGVEPPELELTAPPHLDRLIEHVTATVDRASLIHMMEILGLEKPGPPIRVVLAENTSEEAKLAPTWSVGYAVGNAGLVVLLVDRLPVYPHHSLAGVLRHEIAHVLIARASGRRPVPRWFNEGLAIYSAREWGFEDRSRVLIATLRRDSLALGHLDHDFHAGSTAAARAYALSAAFVRDLAAEHGDRVAARILRRMRRGLPFEEAFREATTFSLAEAEVEFWGRLDFWNRWVPFFTSSATLWIVITLLSLLAFKRRRDLDAEQLERWEAEEAWRDEEPSDVVN